MATFEKAILSVIVYYDMFDYPVTVMEVWRWISDFRFQISDYRTALRRLTDRIEEYRGFYFLSGRKELVRTRLRRYNIAEKKYRRALTIGRILSWMPNVRMIAVTNKLGYSNAREEGDIDLFIVSKRGRIWSCRFFALGFLKVFGLRPKRGRMQDKICTPFFVTEEGLDLSGATDERDVHFHYWLEQFSVIYDADDFYERFRQANDWNREFLPNDYGSELVNQRKLLHCYIVTLLKFLGERFFLGIDEKFYRWLQIRIMPGRLKELAKDGGTDVMISEKMLKLHGNDRRVEYNQVFLKRTNEYGNLRI